MSYPPQPQPQRPQGQPVPHGQQPPMGYPPQAMPVPYVQPGYPPQYAQQPYPMQPYMPHAMPHQPMQVRQVGMSVTKPAWSIGEMLAVALTCGFAYPFVWMSRRSRTTYTRHR